MCYVNKLYYYITSTTSTTSTTTTTTTRAAKRIFGPQGKRKLGPSSNSPNNDTQTKSTTMCDKADDIAILGRNTVFIIQFNFPSGGFRGGVRGVRPPPKIRKAYVIQR